MPGALSVRIREACDRFQALYGSAPRVLARAPARVELLGNHTDYNGGLVMAAAIDRETIIVGGPSPERVARVASAHFDGVDEFGLGAIEAGPRSSWTTYVRGVCWAMAATCGGFEGGFNAFVIGDVPLGAGLSSSASLQSALGAFLLSLGVIRPPAGDEYPGLRTDAGRFALARVLNRSENEFVGVGSGLLDQVSCLFGRKDHAVYLDCSTYETRRIPLGEVALVVCDSRTSRRLADGMYDIRRGECEAGLDRLRQLTGRGAERLSEFRLEELSAHREEPETARWKRARHVLSENDRVQRGAHALEAGDLATFGRLMSESHASSREDFENSSQALDLLIESARESPGFIGGKLSGAGWAGCTINLVRADLAEPFAESVKARYNQASGLDPLVHVCRTAEGASAIEL